MLLSITIEIRRSVAEYMTAKAFSSSAGMDKDYILLDKFEWTLFEISCTKIKQIFTMFGEYMYTGETNSTEMQQNWMNKMLKLDDQWQIWMKNDKIHFDIFVFQPS